MKDVINYFDGFFVANHKSAEKANRQSEKRKLINQSRLNRIKTFMRKVDDLISKKISENVSYDDVLSAARLAEKEIMRGASKSIFHKNTASRKISRMFIKVKKFAK